jgi:amidohydrolase
MSTMLERAEAIREEIIAWRRDIHRHPELSFQETRTARLVADTLRDMGIEAEVGVAKTGVVARIGEGRPAIGIRADMDALPIDEQTNAEYASTVPGVMHACGHDSHTAMLLGVAKLLHEMPDRPTGEIRLLFQPSEEDQDDEGKSGGMRMVEEGALNDLDGVIALHIYSDMPSGMVSIIDGAMCASVDSFEATIMGEGGHGAYPHQTVDPIFILAQVINAIHGIRARRINPVRAAVISIGSIHTGHANNVIPDEVQMNGTIRSFDEETRHMLHQELERAFSVAQALGGGFTLRIIKGYPSQYNDPRVSNLIREVTSDLIGAEQLYPDEAGMGGEDFSFMSQKAPGAMFMLGAKLDSINRPHHNPLFDIDETPLPTGTAILTETAIRLLKQHQK